MSQRPSRPAPKAVESEGGPSPASDGRQGRGRFVAAVLVGLLGALALWIITPYNNYLLLNASIADDYMPVGPIFIVLVMVLGLNPLIRRFRPAWALTRGQLGTALAIMLVACVVPGFGLMRMLPYMLARNPIDVNANKVLAEQYRQMHLPDGMFPDKIEKDGKTPAGEQFVYQHRPGDDPQGTWDAWLTGPPGRFGPGPPPWYAPLTGPLAIWGVFLLFCWMMMIGLAVIVMPQWRHNERLAFPLLTVQESLIADPEPGKLLAPIFRSRAFWIAAVAVCLLHLMDGLNIYLPEKVPVIPLKWNFGQLFSEPPWNSLPLHFFSSRAYFAFIGLAFFMPTRIGFSIWFFIAAYSFYRMLGMAYNPPFDHGTMADHRTGAMLAMTVAILWIGRAQWRRVLGSLWPWKLRSKGAGKRGSDQQAIRVPHLDPTRAVRGSGKVCSQPVSGTPCPPEGGSRCGTQAGSTPAGGIQADRTPAGGTQAGGTNARDRDSARLFVLGLAGMFGWMVWLGLPVLWAVMLVAFAFMISLLIARVVAETGMPFMRLTSDAVYLMKLAPMNWIGPLSLFLASVITILFPLSSRVNGAALAVQGMALAEGEKKEDTGTPGHRDAGRERRTTATNVPASRRPRVPASSRLGLLFLAVLVLGFLAAGASHLWMNYHNGAAVDGTDINGFGLGQFGTINKTLEEFSRGGLSRPRQNVLAHIGFGVALAGLLYWLSMAIPTWPLHPIGLLLIDTPSYGNKVWVSIFIGWAIKGLLVRFGGAMGYRAARPVFLGVIMGEVFAAVLWAIAQIVVVSQGILPRPVEILPG